MKYCIRVDDIGWLPTAPKAADRGLQLAKKFHEAMQGAPYLAAVIPGCLDAAGRAWLHSEPQGMTVAMHGCEHIRVREGLESEFAELDRQQCGMKIMLAKSLLGIETRHFVAPFNGYTPELSDTLRYHGITVHWSGFENENMPPMIEQSEGITIVPSWQPLYAATLWRMSPENEPLINTLPATINEPGMAVITLHLPWEASKHTDFRGVRWLVELIGDLVVSPEEFIR